MKDPDIWEGQNELEWYYRGCLALVVLILVGLVALAYWYLEN